MRIRLLVTCALVAIAAGRAGAHVENEIALQELSALIAEVPDRADLYLRRAECYEEDADWASAESDLRRAMSLAPESNRAAVALGRIYLAAGQLASARAALDDVLRREAHHPVALVLRARVLTRLGEAEAAQADYNLAIQTLAEPSPELFLARAALPIGAARALAGLDEGIARVGPAVTLVEAALRLELQLGRTDAALARLETVASLSERKETWLKRRGDILAAAGRRNEARKAYTAALTAVERLPDWLRKTPETHQLAATLARLAHDPAQPDS